MVMRVANDKFRSLLVNTGELICKLKTTFSTGISWQKQSLKMINAMQNFQAHRHGAPVSKILKLRH